MPNPVPLPTKEEEERRAWVTSHHEVVRLVKDCFGDRFSNNEIFDRLKISRRTGYRALGNDERIGKAPGRKPKILEQTVKEMIEYMEAGGCNDVGNVWKHLAEKYAPDCNPKTVQDAVKKSGFRNFNNSVKLEPLLNEQLAENAPAPNEEEAARRMQEEAASSHPLAGHVSHTPDFGHRDQQAAVNHHQVHNVFDQPLPQHTTPEFLRHAIATFHQDYVRFVLNDLVTRNQEAYFMAYQHFTQVPQQTQQHSQHSMAHLGLTAASNMQIPGPSMPGPDTVIKRRQATCRRCGMLFDRADNKMENRECLYHKGSSQKIDPNATGTIQQSPEAYIWSCCGGNGTVRGCCRAMHTTKKKRKYSSKKRTATEAGMDGAAEEDDPGEDGSPAMDDNDDLEAKAAMLQNAQLNTQHLAMHGQHMSDYHSYQSALAAAGMQEQEIDNDLHSGHVHHPEHVVQAAQAAIRPQMQLNLGDLGGSGGGGAANGGNAIHNDQNGDLQSNIGAQLQAATNGHGV